MITDHELDAILRGILAEEAAQVEQNAPSIEDGVARLLPHVQRHADARGRLVFVLAAALLLVAALASAIAIGQWLPITVDELPPPNPRGEFQPTGMLPQDVNPQALVAQPDGSALLVGDRELFRFEPATGRFAPAGRLQIPRTLPATVVLDDGRVLIVGGGHDNLMHVPRPAEGYRAEVYDPVVGISTLTGSTIHPRGWGTATLLDDGRVLVAGGAAQGFAVETAEIFDPATEQFVETGNMLRPRSGHAAVLLDDGRVLLIGGAGSDAPPDAELFDPATGRFSAAGRMPLAPGGAFGGAQNAIGLPDGRVMIVEASGEGAELTTTVQFYNPATDEFTIGPSVPSPRHDHRIALLDDGRVLILGGWGRNARAEGDDAFIYDPTTTAFTSTSSLGVQRLAPFVVTLDDGRVLVVGSQCWNPGCYGLDDLPGAARRDISAEIYD